VVVSVFLACALGAGCNDDNSQGDAPATTDPGPNPTGVDPGPNDTSGGPITVQGTVRLDGASPCIALETTDGRLSLAFTGYSLTDDAGRAALKADDDDRVLAHDGDQMVVTGNPTGAAPDPCGEPFAVDSLNTVTPATQA
jgi:hypothetical protein